MATAPTDRPHYYKFSTDELMALVDLFEVSPLDTPAYVSRLAADLTAKLPAILQTGKPS